MLRKPNADLGSDKVRYQKFRSHVKWNIDIYHTFVVVTVVYPQDIITLLSINLRKTSTQVMFHRA